MTDILAAVLARAETAEKNGLIATALKLYQKANRAAWGAGGGSQAAREGVKRMKERTR